MIKYTFVILTWLSTLICSSQSPQDTFWHLGANLNKLQTGIDLDRALSFVQSKKVTPIIVAVIDVGVDIYHPDLAQNLWINPDEIPDNGIDDDSNGYIDDIYGWNFIGDVTYDNLEITRQYLLLNATYELKKLATVIDCVDEIVPISIA